MVEAGRAHKQRARTTELGQYPEFQSQRQSEEGKFAAKRAWKGNTRVWISEAKQVEDLVPEDFIEFEYVGRQVLFSQIKHEFEKNASRFSKEFIKGFKRYGRQQSQ